MALRSVAISGFSSRCIVLAVGACASRGIPLTLWATVCLPGCDSVASLLASSCRCSFDLALSGSYLTLLCATLFLVEVAGAPSVISLSLASRSSSSLFVWMDR